MNNTLFLHHDTFKFTQSEPTRQLRLLNVKQSNKLGIEIEIVWFLGFRRGGSEITVYFRYSAPSMGDWLPTFRDNVVVLDLQNLIIR
jgi:hypothetical protein